MLASDMTFMTQLKHNQTKNTDFSFADLTGDDMDTPSSMAPQADGKEISYLIKLTTKKYNAATFGRRIQMKTLLKKLQAGYPLTFTTSTEPNLSARQTMLKMQSLVKSNMTTVENIEQDPMYGDLALDLSKWFCLSITVAV